MAMKPGIHFYVQPEGFEASGPYDLSEMAGLLKVKAITAETPVRAEGSEEWKPFGNYQQYFIAKEMPASAISLKLSAKHKESRSGFPMPSMGGLIKLFGLLLVFVIAGGIAFMIGWTNEPTGMFLVFAGAGTALGAQALILVRVIDDGLITFLLVLLVPLYDILYFVSNIDAYFVYFVAKYLGTTVFLASVIGLIVARMHVLEEYHYHFL